MFRHYSAIVDFLGVALGPDYEIVLQGLESNTIVAIANNHVSGRVIGDPITDSALHMLHSKAYKNNNHICNYKAIAQNGKSLRSSTMFIKDEEGETIGLLHINFDDSRYDALHKNLLSVIHPDSYVTNFVPTQKNSDYEPTETEPKDTATENFFMDIPALMAKMYEEATEDVTVPSDRLNQNEKKEVVAKLHEKGLFQLKGAIPFAARKLSCSTATIYRYLGEITS